MRDSAVTLDLFGIIYLANIPSSYIAKNQICYQEVDKQNPENSK